MTVLRSKRSMKCLVAVMLGVLLGFATVGEGYYVRAASLRPAQNNIPPAGLKNTNIGGIKPGTVVHASTCEQAPPQSQKDRATYTAVELARYGLPPRVKGEPFDKWARIVRSAGRRICDYATSTDRWNTDPHSFNWAGNVADESTPGQNYTEADMDFFVPCITGTPPEEANAAMGAWIGVGGNPSDPLVQTGVAGFQYWDSVRGWHTAYQTFVENTGASDPTAHYFLNVPCSAHIYVSVWGGNCMFLQDIDTNWNTGDQCYGPAANQSSAEAIVERNPDLGNYPYFADFNSVTFLGVGISDNGSYLPMNQVPHTQVQTYDCANPQGGTCRYWSPPYDLVGAITYDPGDTPYDEYSVTWRLYTTQ